MTKFKIALLIFGFCFISLKSQTKITTDFKNYRFEIVSLQNINHLEIIGKHAQINLTNWDKDSISIETTTEIITDKPNLSKELLDEIDIRVLAYANTLRVKTSLNKDFSSTIPYKIIYNIKFPKKLKLSLVNSHGSVHLSDVEGGTRANLSYCGIDIKNLNTLNDSVKNVMHLSYCNGIIENIGSSELEINNSELEINKGNHIKSKTQYSNLVFKKLNTFNGTSDIDLYNVSQVNSIKLTASNSSIVLGSFSDSALFECKMGKLDILSSSEFFKLLTINNDQTITKIHLNEQSSYIINGEIRSASIIHPKIDQLKIIKDDNNLSISGDVGSKSETESKVIIFNNNENIEFK